MDVIKKKELLTNTRRWLINNFVKKTVVPSSRVYIIEDLYLKYCEKRLELNMRSFSSYVVFEQYLFRLLKQNLNLDVKVSKKIEIIEKKDKFKHNKWYFKRSKNDLDFLKNYINQSNIDFNVKICVIMTLFLISRKECINFETALKKSIENEQNKIKTKPKSRISLPWYAKF